MGRKDRLWQHINEMTVLWGSDEYHIMPTTYVLPRDIKKLKAYLGSNPSHVVILKPVCSVIHLFILYLSVLRTILNSYFAHLYQNS